MIAQYLIVDNDQLQQLRDVSDDKRFDVLENLSQTADDNKIVDLGKLWDVLHFALTEQSATTPVPDNALSEFVVGVETFSDDEDADFIAYSEWSAVAEIVDALGQVNFQKRLDKMLMKNLRLQKIFPNGIWNDKKQNLDKELFTSFKELRELYENALDSGCNVVVSIC
ncbi:YfbM family protein [Faucicola mancuniensis]|uniref:YfbM family protein n=1 Tax=Faucicola mancuniensis TaxID=1309795 RepID=UPI00397729E6